MGDDRHHVTRLALLCNRRLAREALAAYFSAQPSFDVLGHAATAECLHKLCTLTRPQAVLVEVEPLEPETVQALRQLRRQDPTLHIVVTYTDISRKVLTDAARDGLLSFTPSSNGLDGIATMLHCRASGDGARRRAVDGQRLTTRELAVVSLLASGHTTADIAALLRISPHTVDNHKRRVYAKLGVGSQSLAVARAVSLGLVPEPWLASQTRPDYSTVPHLTSREQDVLRHIVQGHTTRQSARALGIAAKTVENTQARLYRKLGTHSRAETLTVAYRYGLVDPAVPPRGSASYRPNVK